ncbi:MAG: GNAT family N-acetyltransferase [Candidatus Faecousia sp.]|nr:GNAT family N-acetyltransferase [Candidatus Faecousia sp.]
MELREMTQQDKAFVMGIDSHMDEAAFQNRLLTKSGFVLWEAGQPVGWMHHCVLWDNLPFLNLLYVLEDWRGKGFGRQTMAAWEAEMKNRGYKMVLISTQSDESAQHFYRKQGYVDCGCLVFQNTPFDQPTELFFRKVL